MRKNSKKQKYIKLPPDQKIPLTIAIPQMEYKVVKQPILKTEFRGSVSVIPTVLIFYLKSIELRTVAVIIQETMENGICALTPSQFSIRMKIKPITLYHVMYCLRRMNVIYEERYGRHVKRVINFKAIQHLEDLVKEEDRGVYVRLRRKCKLKNIAKIDKTDLEKIYDQHVLDPNHDIEEEEEYD